MADYDDEELRCKRCGARGFKWQHTRGGWRLAFGGQIHQCKVKPKVAAQIRKETEEARIHEAGMDCQELSERGY